MPLKKESQTPGNATKAELADRYNSLMNQYAFNKNADRKFGQGKKQLIVSIKSKGGINLPEYKELKIAKNGVIFYPEFVAYLFQIDGVAIKLLMFLVFHYLDPQKNTFLFNAQVIADFNLYCKATINKEYKEANVRQVLRKSLEAKNIVVNVARGKYMLNPMIGGCNNFRLKKTLISEYNNWLTQKGKDLINDFYPKLT